MTDYLVTWQIDVETEDIDEAIEKAREIQLDPLSIATAFTVKDKETGVEILKDMDGVIYPQ